jgi:hypothetical protein
MEWREKSLYEREQTLAAERRAFELERQNAELKQQLDLRMIHAFPPPPPPSPPMSYPMHPPHVASPPPFPPYGGERERPYVAPPAEDNPYEGQVGPRRGHRHQHSIRPDDRPPRRHNDRPPFRADDRFSRPSAGRGAGRYETYDVGPRDRPSWSKDDTVSAQQLTDRPRRRSRSRSPTTGARRGSSPPRRARHDPILPVLPPILPVMATFAPTPPSVAPAPPPPISSDSVDTLLRQALAEAGLAPDGSPIAA